MKAHDVRHLCFCAKCRDLADDRETINIRVHGACAFKMLGVEGILKMPRAEQAKLTLADIGPQAMKRLIDKIVKEDRPKK